MSKKNADHSIGYERLLVHFSDVQKQSPKGVGLKRTGGTIALQFKVGETRKAYGCSSTFTYDGMADALKKAKKVAEALKTIDSETKFWEWYDDAILEKNSIKADLLTFGEAIALVEKDFWSRPSRYKRKRDRLNPSDVSCWNVTYGQYYKHFPTEVKINPGNFLAVADKFQVGTKTYKDCISALKKLARIANHESGLTKLNELKTIQVEFKDLQTITLKNFLTWRSTLLGENGEIHPRANLDSRKRWLWAFSMQIVYGLRIHEVFAIQNLEKPFKTKDGIFIPSLNDSQNNTNIIVIGELTGIGTTTKTSYRLARPLIPPSCPNLIEKLEIKNPMLPTSQPKSFDADNIRKFYAVRARKQLITWKAPFTQTHALRHLANLNGMTAGISQEIRSQSLGHTPQMNESVYKKRQHTTETLNLLLNSNKQAIDLLSAINEARSLLEYFPSSAPVLSKLLSKIYSKDESEIVKLLVLDKQ
ncbi:MAG: hypothetical protein MUD14_09755 [Hydrococcus sp. Prado102]|jgi:hypothetical protein|nr:hypothetical protein [Hydrococcus sp. Prado102]